MTLSDNMEMVQTDRSKIGLDPAIIREDFPILNRLINDVPLVYLDSAATTQKPQAVLDAIDYYYSNSNSNVHRGLHQLASEATDAYELTRKKIAAFIGAESTNEVIFTANATQAFNLVAHGWARRHLKQGDHVLISEMEHHANLVPWIVLEKELGIILDYIPFNENGELILDDLNALLHEQTKLVSVTQMSNVFGTINPVELIIEHAHSVGALVMVDGAQSLPHMPVNVSKLDVDFFAFSAHKMLGPTGVGVLYAKEALLESMNPFILGGEMIGNVGFHEVDWAELPHKFEAGTPNIAGVAAFSGALDYLDALGMENIRAHEVEILDYALSEFAKLEGYKLIGPNSSDKRGGALTFIGNEMLHPHDIAQVLDSRGVAIRAGHHCAQPLHKKLGIVASARASFYIYTSKSDIDKFIEGLIQTEKYFGL